MIMAKFNLRHENVVASFLYALASWGLLYAWLCLMHYVNEKGESTLPFSSPIRISIAIAVLFFIIQKRPGVLKTFFIITSGTILTFLQIITALHLLLKIMPDVSDLVFYYECFLLLFFCGLPMYLCLRMI
ncbi:TPA: transporter [Enterobacter cloacae]|nr:transporter [Enterobacter pasteurii]